jgi:ABC-type lipoprotein release transport system permease subunit
VSAIWVGARAEIRRRWRPWLGVALLIGVFGGVVTAAAAGARRTDDAYSRFAASHHAAQYLVEDFVPNADAAVLNPAAVAALPSVAEADSFRVFGPINDIGYELVASPDGQAYGAGLSRLKLLRGRLPDSARADEAVADFTLPHVRIGQPVTVPLVPSIRGDTHHPDLSGRHPLSATFTVVGIVAAPGQFPPLPSNSYYNEPNFYLTPAFYQAHRTSTAAYEFSLVRLRPGQTARAERQLNALGHGQEAGVQELAGQARDVDRSIHLVAVGLWLLAGLLALVAVLVLGQLLARQITLDATGYPVLHALGLTRRQLIALTVLRSTVIGGAGGVLAAGVAIALSPFAPIGVARTAEPAPGFAVDVPVLLIAVAGTTALIALLSLWPAWRTAQAAVTALSRQDQPGLARRSIVADTCARAGLPVTVTAGVRMALERGRGPASVPVRTSVGGAVVGLAAMVAALVFGASLGHLLTSPRLYGVTWDTEIWNNNGPGPMRAAEPVVRADPDVATAAFIQTGVDFQFRGRTVLGFAFTPVKGTFGAAMLTGREPAGASEVAFGANTAAQLGVRPGATLTGNAEHPGAPLVPVRMVGTAVLPPGDVSAHLGDGVIVTRQGLVRLAGGQARSPYVMAVTFRPGTGAAAEHRLDHRLAATDPNFFTQVPATPTDLVNFGQIQELPVILGSVLAVLALLTVAHLLATSIRRRRRDVAVLKTLGFTPGDLGRAVAWQATTLALVTLLAGLPLGLVAGRLAWRLFAGQLGVVPGVSIPGLLLALIVPAAIVLAVLVSIGPAVTAMRVRPAATLRQE